MPEVISLIPAVIFDTAKWGYHFGNVTKQPPANARPGEIVTATFVSRPSTPKKVDKIQFDKKT